MEWALYTIVLTPVKVRVSLIHLPTVEEVTPLWGLVWLISAEKVSGGLSSFVMFRYMSKVDAGQMRLRSLKRDITMGFICLFFQVFE